MNESAHFMKVFIFCFQKILCLALPLTKRFHCTLVIIEFSFNYQVNTIFKYLLCLVGMLWKVQGSGMFTHSGFRNCHQASKSLFSCKNIGKITLSQRAVINSTCLKEEYPKLSEIKSATASNLATDYQSTVCV